MLSLDPLRAWLERSCRVAGFSLRITQEVRHPHDYAALVRHGVGIGLGFGFARTWSAGDLASNLILRVFSDPQLAIETAVIFGERFNFAPLSGYIDSVVRLGDQHKY